MKSSYKMAKATATIPANPSGITKLFSNLILALQGLYLAIVQALTPSDQRKVVIVGQSSYAQKLIKIFNSDKSEGYNCVGLFDIEKNNDFVSGNIPDLKEFCLKNQIDEIYFTRSLEEKNLIQDLSNFADKNFIYFRIATDAQAIAQKANQVNTYFFDDVPVMAVRKEPLSSRFNQICKRAFDIVFSLMALAFLVPFVYPIIALAIKLESRGPIFFIQKRPGKRNQLFNCIKFRSMTVNTNTEQQATKNDARITKVGAFIRKTSLDELPQFINVLLGDMSVVGPRPNMVKQLEYYSQHIDNYSFRHFVTPGITGLAQVNGFRGETQTLDLMEKRVALDIEYIEKWSLWLDIKLVFLTVYNMVKGEENAY